MVTKKALVLGCSHAAGAEMSTVREFRLANSYPAVLAQRLGYEVTNMAISGGSNDAMFRLFEQHGHDYELIVACWTGCNRTEVCYDTEWMPVCVGAPHHPDIKQYHEQWLLHTEDQSGRLNKIKNIVALNSMAHDQGKTVINVDSFWTVYTTWPSTVSWAIDTDLWTWANAQNYPRYQLGHFGPEAHVAFADLILKNYTPFAKLV